jgi:hypothetical protein
MLEKGDDYLSSAAPVVMGKSGQCLGQLRKQCNMLFVPYDILATVFRQVYGKTDEGSLKIFEGNMILSWTAHVKEIFFFFYEGFSNICVEHQLAVIAVRKGCQRILGGMHFAVIDTDRSHRKLDEVMDVVRILLQDLDLCIKATRVQKWS